MPDPKWRGKREELLLVDAAVNRELDSFTSRDNAMQGRATVLIGAASVVGAIQLGDAFTPFLVANLLLSFFAAVFGVLVIFPRSGDAPNPRMMRDELLKGMSDEEALYNITDVKLDNLDADDKSLITRGWFAKIGFILLALSIVAAVLGAMNPATPQPAPTSTPEAVASAEG